jgi:hypothetical protein
MEVKDRVVKNCEFVFRCRFVVLILFYHTMLFREQTWAQICMVTWPNLKILLRLKIGKNVFSHLKEFVFGYKISERMWVEITFCAGSGRRTSVLKLVKNSYGFVGPSVETRVQIYIEVRCRSTFMFIDNRTKKGESRGYKMSLYNYGEYRVKPLKKTQIAIGECFHAHGMGSQWRHRRNREKKRYRRAPRCPQMPGAPGSDCPERKSRLGSVSTRETCRLFLLFIVLAWHFLPSTFAFFDPIANKYTP